MLPPPLPTAKRVANDAPILRSIYRTISTPLSINCVLVDVTFTYTSGSYDLTSNQTTFDETPWETLSIPTYDSIQEGMAMRKAKRPGYQAATGFLGDGSSKTCIFVSFLTISTLNYHYSNIKYLLGYTRDGLRRKNTLYAS